MKKGPSPSGAKETLPTIHPAPHCAGICTLDAIFEYPLSWLLVFTAVAA